MEEWSFPWSEGVMNVSKIDWAHWMPDRGGEDYPYPSEWSEGDQEFIDESEVEGLNRK